MENDNNQYPTQSLQPVTDNHSLSIQNSPDTQQASISSLPPSKKKKTILFVTIFSLIAIASIVAAIIVPKILEQNEKDRIAQEQQQQEEEEEEKKNSMFQGCMQGADQSNIINKYEAEINCYETYQPDGYEEKISELSEILLPLQQNKCINDAFSNYAITEQEIAEAYGDIAAQNLLSARLINRYNAQINCYNTYHTNSSDQKIAELENKKQELLSLQADANNPVYYTEPETPSPAYSIPTIPETTQTDQCEYYYSTYRSEYNSTIRQINTDYNNALYEASMQCTSNGGAFGGCIDIAKRQLDNQKNESINQANNTFRQSLLSVGCGDYYDL